MTTQRIEERLLGLAEQFDMSLRGVAHKSRLPRLRKGHFTTDDQLIAACWQKALTASVAPAKRVRFISDALTRMGHQPPTHKGIRDSLKRQRLLKPQEESGK